MIESIDATRRRLFVWIVLATLLAWAVGIGALVRGGRADPQSLRPCWMAAGGSTSALTAVAFTMLAFFGGELLDPIGVPGIWFPFGIGVSWTQYIFAILVPLFAVLVVRTLGGSGPPQSPGGRATAAPN